MESALSVRLFGPLEVTDAGGRPVEIGTPKQRAVLAMLALDPGRIVSLDRLMDELWEGEAPSSATGTLQAYISLLRRALEPERAPRAPSKVLLTRAPGYLLAVAPVQVDLVRFRTWAEDGRRELAQGRYGAAIRLLEQALTTWRGEPLAEFTGYEFAQPVVARLTELRAQAVEDLFEARLALGDGGACVADLEGLVEAHPYRERLWGLLVRALYRAGRQADALAALRRVRAVLAEELGIEPGAELRRLEQAVFDQSPELDPAVPVPVAERDAPETARGEYRGDLVARQAQMRRIGERLAGVRRGRGGVLLVTGEAGVGKTRLAQAAAEEAAARGLAVAWGRCAEDTGAPAFWPWLQVLRDLEGAVGTVGAVGAVGARTATPAGSPAGTAVAGALRMLTGQELPANDDPGAALFELHERVVAGLTSGDVPALVVLDDLHWADASSLRLLAFAAAELSRRPMLVLVTMRPEPGDEPEQLNATLATLSREPTTERMPLRPFTREEVSSYLSRHDLAGAGPDLAGVLHERSGGNPFYLGELLRLLGSEHRLDGTALGIPEGVREVVGRRLARLPEPTGELLRSAAVLGRDIGFDALEAMTGTPAEEVLFRLEPAVVTGLVVEVPGGFDYRFSHALVRDTLYAGLGRLEQARLHLRAGEALESLPGGENTARLTSLAHHFAMAARVGGAAKAVRYAAAAAGEATARRAYDEAVRLWERALALAPEDRCELLIGYGRALRDVGDLQRAREALEEAIDLAARTGNRSAMVEAVAVFGCLSVWNWQPYGVVDTRMVAFLDDLLREPLDAADRVVVLGTLAVEVNYGPRRAEGERMAAEAVELAREIGDPVLLARALNNYLVSAWVAECEDERRQAAEEMLALPDLPAPTEIVARVFRMIALFRLGELQEWERDLERAERLLQEVRRPELEAMVRVAEASRRVLDRDWERAERLTEEYGGLLDKSTMWGMEYARQMTLFACRRGQGRVPEILPGLVAAAGMPYMEPLRPVAVLAALDAGDPELARTLMRRWGTVIRDDWSAEFVTVVWAHVSVRLGVPEPGALYDRLAPYGDRLIGNGSGMLGWGTVHLVLAELCRAMGDPVRSREHAEAAHRAHLRLGLAHWAGESARLLAELDDAPAGVRSDMKRDGGGREAVDR
ncbi:BTAD domain-containing putative transcriptional regulator [Streptosporangium sp. NPDC051022]|uniref:BTAD domain-containing putative transcriptional regulator n=1 Tax=Streptosporangium sp. NPDC051022 TaxID=3155752 RepID=UPI003432DDFC